MKPIQFPVKIDIVSVIFVGNSNGALGIFVSFLFYFTILFDFTQAPFFTTKQSELGPVARS